MLTAAYGWLGASVVVVAVVVVVVVVVVWGVRVMAVCWRQRSGVGVVCPCVRGYGLLLLVLWWWWWW